MLQQLIERRHRHVAALTATIAIIGLVAACSSTKSPDDPSATPSSETPAVETVAAPATSAQVAVAAPSPGIVDRPPPAVVQPASVTGAGGSGSVEVPAAPSFPTGDVVTSPKRIEDAAGAIVLDGCGAAGLPFVVIGLASGLAGVPLPVEPPVILPLLTPACTAFGFPESQTVCPNDRPAGVAMGPPPQGRVIDVVDGVENEAGSAGAPDNGVAPTARGQLGCSEVAYP